MRFIKSNTGLGHRQYMVLFQLQAREHLVVGIVNPTDDYVDIEIGSVIRMELYEMRDAQPISFEQAKQDIASVFLPLITHLYEKDKKQDQDRYLDSYFLVQERTDSFSHVELMAALKSQGLVHHYSDGGYLNVKCSSKDRDAFIQFFRNKGLKAGSSFTNIS